MDNQPLVSVIMATYNKADYIERAVKSVLAQNYKNIELIIVDDGSTDGTKELIQPFLSDQRIYYFQEENKGVSIARNNGVRISKGKYIAILDSDDFWCQIDKLEKQVDFLEKNKDYALVGGGAIKIDKRGKEITRYLLFEKDEDIRKVILVDNAFAHVTTLFRKDIFERVGGYSEEFDGLEDRELWLKIGTISKFYNFQEFFTSYLGHNYKDPTYFIKNYSGRERLKLNIRLRKRYSNNYPGYRKAVLLCWASYFHSFIPFRKKLWPIIFKLRVFIFGSPPYEYFKI